MLAEPRFKTRYILNPKKCAWSADEGNLGRKLMERMGWSDGKGLGRTEQGCTDPIKVTYKNNSKGMGYKGHPDCPVQQQEEFSALLSQLNQAHQGSAVGSDKDSEPLSSLEQRSEKSRARLHYKKFTRGKDLSRYSSKDLACIIGSTKKKPPPSPAVKVESEQDSDLTFGVPTTNGGLIGDYFKLKMKAKTKSVNPLMEENSSLVEEKRDDENLDKKKKKKKKSRPIIDMCNVGDELGFADTVQQEIKIKKKKCKVSNKNLDIESVEETPKKKKRKHAQEREEAVIKSKKQKSKGENEFDEPKSKKSKKKKSSRDQNQ